MNFEEIKDIFTAGGGALVLLLTLVQISPIKINPWSWLAKHLGNALNTDVLSEVKDTKKRLDDHIRMDDQRNADLLRSRILQFNCELLNEKHHTREDFIEILAVIDDYEDYCRDHPEYRNNRCVHAVANIKRVYDDRMVKHDFA